MDTPHRIKLPTTLTLDGAIGVALPWYDGFMYDDGGETAWVNVPAEDCPCNFATEPAWHAALTAKYGGPQKVTAWARIAPEAWPDSRHQLAVNHDPTPRIEGERVRARLEDKYEDATPGARAALVKAMRDANRTAATERAEA